METPTGHDRKALVCFYEFLGQIFFMYIAIVSGGGSDTWGIAGPLALFAIINIFGAVSGGHFNPAVTLGVYVREAQWSRNIILMFGIIVCQIGGALVGMLLAFLSLRVPVDGEYKVPDSIVPLLLPATVAEGVKNGNVVLSEGWATFYMEIICTCIFVLFILHVTGKHTGAEKQGLWIPASICTVLWALCKVDAFTGASFNPALAIGSTFFQAWAYSSNPSGVMTHYLLMYIGGAALGGILAGTVYHIHQMMFKNDSDAHGSYNGSPAINSAYSHSDKAQ